MDTLNLNAEMENREFYPSQSADSGKMRKVKPDMVLNLVLDLVNESHIKTLQELLVTPDDRKEQIRQFYIETRGPISKPEYTGFTMKREYFEFLEQYEAVKEKHSIRIAG